MIDSASTPSRKRILHYFHAEAQTVQAAQRKTATHLTYCCLQCKKVWQTYNKGMQKWPNEQLQRIAAEIKRTIPHLTFDTQVILQVYSSSLGIPCCVVSPSRWLSSSAVTSAVFDRLSARPDNTGVLSEAAATSDAPRHKSQANTKRHTRSSIHSSSMFPTIIKPSIARDNATLDRWG
jgi:hypothetical protein